MIARFYRVGRRRYGLLAADAFRYAADRALLWSSDSPLWASEPDPDGGLLVCLYDEKERLLDVLGGVDVPFSVSDHGNVNLDDEDPYLVGVVAGMVRDLGTGAGRG